MESLKHGGTLCGAFSSAAVIQCGELAVTLHDASLPSLPLGVGITDFKPSEYIHLIGVKTEMPDNILQVGDDLAVDLRTAAKPSHKIEFKDSLAESRRQMREKLIAVIRESLRETGFSVMAEGLYGNGVSEESLGLYVNAYRAVLELRKPNSEDSVLNVTLNRLIGLGAGLTPSGDDFITGYLTTLRAFYGPASRRVEALTSLLPRYADKTTLYGWSELYCAMSGYAPRLLLDLLKAGPDCRPAALRLAAVGSSTGVDMLLGIAEALFYAY